MKLQTVQQIITIHISSNILRSKGDQAIKFGQFVENKMRNMVFEKSYIKCGGEARPRPFYKKSKFSMSLDCHSEML